MILSGTRSPERGLGQSRLAIDQAITALRMGDKFEAELTLRRHLLEQPGDSDALAKLAEIAIDSPGRPGPVAPYSAGNRPGFEARRR